MSNRTSRRQLVRQLVQVTGGIASAGAAGTLFARVSQTARPAAAQADAGMRRLPWPYKPLDPDAAGQRAFDSMAKGGCMFGAFDALAGSVADQLGAPYTDFPFQMAAYGGGINGWGTVCGALNGSAAAFQLISARPGPLVDALFAWYDSEALPNFAPKGMKFAEIRSVAGLPLCHQSIAMWCKVSKKGAYTPERGERCAALTASAARKAVLLLNDQVASKPVSFALPQLTQSCIACHGRGGAQPNALTKMDCGGCHAPLIGKHPQKS